MSLFQNKYRIPSTRLPDWDYSQPGFYFITLCTHKFSPFFGKLINQKMIPSPIGEIVFEEWVNTGTKRLTVNLDAWLFMPDHMHMIVEITHTVETPRPINVETTRRPRDFINICGVSLTYIHNRLRGGSKAMLPSINSQNHQPMT